MLEVENMTFNNMHEFVDGSGFRKRSNVITNIVINDGYMEGL